MRETVIISIAMWLSGFVIGWVGCLLTRKKPETSTEFPFDLPPRKK